MLLKNVFFVNVTEKSNYKYGKYYNIVVEQL